MNFKRILSATLALVFAFALSAGALAEAVLSDAGAYPIIKEGGSTLTVAHVSNQNIVDFNKDNYMTDYLSERLGATVFVELFPSTDATTKITMMVNSGTELPDVLSFGGSIDWALRNTYAEAGALYPCDEFFVKGNGISDSFYARCEEIGLDANAILNEARSLDGHIYGFPYIQMKLANIYDNRAWINQDFLDALNLEAPTTIDELTEVLIAIRDGDPNGNGIADEIPMTGVGSNAWTSNGNVRNWLQNMFIYNDLTKYRFNRLDRTDGVLDVVYDKEEYREFLKYVNMLVRENLLDIASFTQTTSEMRTGLQADTQTCGLMVGSANGFGQNLASWQPLEQPEGFYGDRQITYHKPSVNTTFIITKDCEMPEAAARLAMMCYENDDMVLIGRYGEPNVDWRYAETGEISVFNEIDVEPNIVCLNVVWGNITNHTWQDENAMPHLDSMKTHVEVFDGNEVYGERLHGRSVSMNIEYAPNVNDVAGTIRYTNEEQDQCAELRTALQSYVDEATGLFCIGQLDPNSDEDWNAYLNELEHLQYQELLEVDRVAYERTYGTND